MCGSIRFNPESIYSIFLKNVDERWRPVGGGAVQVDGFSATGQDGGEGGAGAKRKRSDIDG